jgi:predicted phosphohydrolase
VIPNALWRRIGKVGKVLPSGSLAKSTLKYGSVLFSNQRWRAYFSIEDSGFVKIVATSDTHSRHDALNVPDGDVFVHAGDFSGYGSLKELSDFNAWLGSLPHCHKLIIAGNHDWCFETMAGVARSVVTNAHYLQDEGVEIDGVQFYGSPWQPWFLDWAFNLPRGEPLREKWSLIPESCDVLITHGPPHGIGDLTVRGENVGCRELLKALERVRPKVHIFGHIHEGAGVVEGDHTTFANVSFLDVTYKPKQDCTVLEIC